MELIARVLLTGFDGEPVEADVALEAYDLSQTAWRGVAEMLKPLRIVSRTSRDQGRYAIAFSLNGPAMAALFGATASFRLVTAPVGDDGQAEVIVAAERVVANSERVEMDFGTVLFLGDRGFVTVEGEGGTFCSGVALAVQDAALAAAQRRFYARPRELEEIAADRDRVQARLAELETLLAAARKALGACEAAGARLTRQNATLTQQARKAAADLRACVGERRTLAEQLSAAATRTVAVEGKLKACAAERERLSADLTARTSALETAIAARDACAAERGQLTEELAAATARAAAAEKEVQACAAERERLSAELAARTSALGIAVAERDACAAERGKLTKQLAAADASLRSCVAGRRRLSADLAARTKALATAVAERDACAGERSRLTEQLAGAATRAAAAEANLEACIADRERAAADLAGRNKDLADAVAQLEECARAREALASELAQVRAGFDATLRQLQELQAEFRDAAEARTRAERDLAACHGRAAELETAIGEAGAALEACRLAEAEAGRRANAAELARTALNDRLLALEAEAELRAAELAELRERVSNERSYVDRLRDTLTAETAKASAAAQQLDAVRRQHQAEVPATQLIADLATSIGAVNRQLVASDIPYRLGRTDVTLKTFLSDGGGRMSLPDAAYRVEEAALSEISMELIPDDAPDAIPAGELIVPDLLGLTETAVIRVLSSLFLKADKASETVADPARHGRALRQIPRAGALAERGRTVLVVYGAQGASAT